jgi:uncharacterized protein YlxW (UPF0749 family)
MVVFIILGIILGVQFRSTLAANRQKSSLTMRIEQLMVQINEQIELENRLKAEIEENAVQREGYLKNLVRQGNSHNLLDEWEYVKLKTGLSDVTGPGVVIKLDDAVARKGVDPQMLIIHDQDIREILNELKKAGAQAISINGERIVAMSEQVCAGPTILINRNRYSVPYVINAIGDPDLLYDSLIRSERIALMIDDKIQIDIKKSKDVLVPKFSNMDKLDKLISGMEAVKK